jgi:hypothetical protein
MIFRIPAFILLFLCLLDPASASQSKSDPAFKQINSIVNTLSVITGLSEEHAVPVGRISQSQLRKFLAHRVKTTLKAKEVYADELSLKMFGLVPADFDLRKSTVDLLTEQAAAFYDYQEKKLMMLDAASFSSEELTLSHELAHALADQHFNLSKFVEDTSENDDENLAHAAVVEGQASWLMLAYQMRQQGIDAPPTQDVLSSVENSAEVSESGFPVLQHSPLYIQQSLMFPYTAGTKFFDEVFKAKGKEAFSKVFTDPPKDTSQILHPDRYFHHDQQTSPEIPKVELKNVGKQIGAGSVGEFDHQILLWQSVGKQAALELAPHVRGGTFRIVETGKNKAPVLEYVSEWDTEDHAESYFTAYQTILRKKWNMCDPLKATDTVFAGKSNSGYFVAKLRGRIVSSVEGVQEFDDWKAVAAD